MDFCLPARATTLSPLPLTDEASGSKYYSACPKPVLIYQLLVPTKPLQFTEPPPLLRSYCFFCMTHEIFLTPALLSAPERGSSGI